MKKLFLFLVCALILAIFIGFNYLLWDRENREKDIENLQYSNATNNSTINALGRQINQLDEDKNALKAKVNDLEFNNKLLSFNNNRLEQDNEKLKQDVKQKNEIINMLKQAVDFKILENPVRNWVEGINKGDYLAAFRQMNQEYFKIKSLSGNFDEFSAQYQGIVKSIEIETIQLYTNGISEESKGDIVIDAILEVSLEEGESKTKTQFKEGKNQCYFTIIYDGQKGEWRITNIIII